MKSIMRCRAAHLRIRAGRALRHGIDLNWSGLQAHFRDYWHSVEASIGVPHGAAGVINMPVTLSSSLDIDLSDFGGLDSLDEPGNAVRLSTRSVMVELDRIRRGPGGSPPPAVLATQELDLDLAVPTLPAQAEPRRSLLGPAPVVMAWEHWDFDTLATLPAPLDGDRSGAACGLASLEATSATELSIEGLLQQLAEQMRHTEDALAQVRLLEAQVSADQEAMTTLGRRFGQWTHESFFSFVARLGMAARSTPLSRGLGTRATSS
jgi:hypothetical protein